MTIMPDPAFEYFLREQARAVAELTASADRLRVHAEPGAELPSTWIAEFDCSTLVRRPGGPVERVEGCAVWIHLPHDYLARVDTFEILRLIRPEHPFHPNVHPVARLLCAGHVYPAMSLVELLFQIHQVLTWRNVTLVESDALNPDACAWARSNPDGYPVDDRPMRGDAQRFRAVVRGREIAR